MDVWVRRIVALLVATGAGVLGVAGVACAATFTVDNPADAPLPSPAASTCPAGPTHCTLRQAVQAADNIPGTATTITVEAGTYALSRPSTATNQPADGDLDVNNNTSVTITGAGSGATTIDANGVDRAFAVQAGAGLSLSGLTIENGSPSTNSTQSPLGGAIYSDGALAVSGDVTFTGNTSTTKGGAIYDDNGAGSALALTGATFENNVAPSGGAIYDALSSSGTATIDGSTFTANREPSAGGSGGAIYGEGGNLTVNNSRFSGNQAGVGGGIYWNTQSELSVTGSSLTGNTADSGGGALFDNGSTSTTLSHDRFQSNHSGSDGGALYLAAFLGTTYSFDHDEFDANAATGSGGAVYAFLGALNATSSSFIDNRAGSDGGAVYTQAGSSDPLSLTNVTATGNTADKGGGLYLDVFTPLTMTNDTITTNTATSGAGGGVGLAGNATGTATGIRNTVVADNAGGDCTANYGFTNSQDPGLTVDGGHNLDGDSSCFGVSAAPGDKLGVDPRLGTPADNGGAVLTSAEAPDSPTVDAGTTAGCPATDARDVPRPSAGPCDMGAVQAPALTLALSESAPSAVAATTPYTYTLTVASGGYGASTNTTVTDQLPAGTALRGASSSSGACTSSGAPARVTCDLGTLANGSAGTVTIALTATAAGSVTNSAAVADDQNATATASATTQVTPAPAKVGAPTAVTTGATEFTRTGVTLLGQVNTGGQRTSYFFQYGATTSYGKATATQATTATGAVQATITRLTPGRRYHFRLVATNASGVAQGVDRSLVAGLPRPRLTLAVKPGRARAAPYRFALSGTLRLPRAVPRAHGCIGAVTITIRAGARRLARRAVKVSRRCHYSAEVSVARIPGHHGHGTLWAVAVFGGSRRLAGNRSRRLRLHYG